MSTVWEATAAGVFRAGQRVKMTALGAEWFPRSPRCGVVVRLCRDPHVIVVKRHGRKAPLRYHTAFWEPA